MNYFIKLLFLFSLCLLNAKISFGQQRYEFNREGNTCYFKYICYSPTGNYEEVKRPFLLVLAKPGQDAQAAFEQDSLKNQLQFHNYLFVYVPNTGKTASEKLQCLNALSSILTFNFTYGNNNLFLQINDPGIGSTEVNATDLSFFKSIRLSEKKSSLHDTSVAGNIIHSDFREDVSAYDNIVEDEEDGGTYYVEENELNTPEIAEVKSQKTYFGPPQTFNYTLSGLIKDKATGEALPGATIQVMGKNIGTSTNMDGYFTMAKVPTDTSTLQIQYLGYNKNFVYLTPRSPKKLFIIELSPSSQNLKTVTITGSREDVVLVNKTEVSTIKMTPKKLEQLPNVGERDVMRSFQLMPGISASNESSSGLYVRGGTPDQNLVLYDGFTVYQVDHLYGFFSAFNSNAIKDVQLYKGGFESRFGGRLSSVTEITGKDGNQKKFNMGADLSLLSMNANLEIPIGSKFSSIITFRRSYKGPIYNKIFEKFNKNSSSTTPTTPRPGGGPGGGGFSQETKATSYFYDLNSKFTYRPNDKDIVTLSIFNGTDKLDNSASSSLPAMGGGASSNFSFSSTDLTKYGNFGSSFKWSRKWNQKLYGNTILSYSNYFSDRDRSQERTLTNSSGETTTTNNGIFENNDLKDYSLKSDYQLDLLNFSQLQFGAFGTYYDIKYTYAQNETTTILDRHNKSLLAGGYVQSKLKLFKDQVQFLPGIRTSYFETTGNMYHEPRASLSVNLTRRLTLKGATGKYYQFSNRVTREDILSGSKDFWLLSDGKKVPVSSAIHYIAGLSFETNSYLFSAEGYYKNLDNLTDYSLRINASPFKVDYNENFFSGYGYSKGIEFLVQKKSGNFNGWVCYTLGKAHNHFEAYSDTYFPANQDVTHEFKIVALYKWKRWDFSATWVYATGRPYTAPSGAYSVTLLDGSSSDYFTVTSKNGLRLPDYHRADISANFKLLRGNGINNKRREIGYIGFSIFNLYDRKNVWYKQYTIESRSIIETNVNYLGITPNITLSLKLR